MVNTREIAAEYRLSHWARIIGEQKSSGLNIREFCRREGFNPNVYHYWQRKLREATCFELTVRAESAVAKAVPSGWAAVTEAEPATSSAVSAARTLPIEIGSCRVVASSDTDDELLAKVCKVLVGLC